MITGEYLVLKGGLAMAVPTVLGQEIQCTHDDSRPLHMVNWIAKVKGDIAWYSNQFLIDNDFEPAEDANSQRTLFIRSLLIGVNALNPEFFRPNGVYSITTHLDFDPSWGLGSSSSLIANLAYIAEVEPFELLFASSLNKGSGYDLAVSILGQPINYHIEEGLFHWAEPVELAWKGFARHCRLVFLNRKQDSHLEVSRFISKRNQDHQLNAIEEINHISKRIPAVSDYREFCDLLYQHEQIMGEVLKKKCIKEQLFPDFPGVIKSLGAWEGDFILVCPENENPQTAEHYFTEKGYKIVMDFGKMIDYEWK
jgi:mevalonate kinase